MDRLTLAVARRASVTFDPEVAEKIKKLTARNDATKAYILGCKMLGATPLVKKLELVSKIQDLEGYLPSGLNTYRYSIYQEMLEIAKGRLTPDEYDQFYKLF
jgi:hypothetical protein